MGIIGPANSERSVPTPPCASPAKDAAFSCAVSANGMSVKKSLNDGEIGCLTYLSKSRRKPQWSMRLVLPVGGDSSGK